MTPTIKTFDEIVCPKCGTRIPVSETLRHQLTQHIQEELEEKVGKRVQEEVAQVREKLDIEAKKRAEDAVSVEVKDMREHLRENQAKLAKAEQMELDWRKRERELEQRERNVELETARRVAAERQKVQEEFAEEHRLRDAEKDKKLQDAIKANEELRRKLQQGSQQTQGEVLQLQVEELIRTSFPSDIIEPVPIGVNGADVVHRVCNRRGNDCGIIVWELKYTKAWSDPWVQKLKDDLRRIKGDIALLVTETLPKGVEHFSFFNGIWVTSPKCAMALAGVLRRLLIEVATTRLSAVGKNEKMEILYEYLSGSGFRQRVEAIVERFIEMQKDLQTERRDAERCFSKREKQLQCVIANTAGMYGDFQGLIGAPLHSIPALSAGEEPEVTTEGASPPQSAMPLGYEIIPDDIPF